MYITIHAVYAFPSRDGETPLLCAAASGQDDVVAYLLKFSAVLAELKKPTTASASVSCSAGYIHLYIYIYMYVVHVLSVSLI